MDVDADVNSDSESDAVQDSDHYSHENIPSPAESSHDEFEEVAPKKKPRKSAMKGAGAALKRKKNVQIRKDHDSDNFLYETLTEATVDLPTAVQDWLAMYVDSRREALRILINCLIKVCLSIPNWRVIHPYHSPPAVNTQLHQIKLSILTLFLM